MSLLDQIKKRKSVLKQTSTLVTQADGKQFIETKSSIKPVTDIMSSYGFIVDTKIDNVPALIIPHLYLGSQDCCDPNILFKYTIQYVLSIGIEISDNDKMPNVIYKFVKCLDIPETHIVHVLQECLPFIENAININANILVHCNAGVSRSASIVIGFLIIRRRLSYIDSYNLVKAARSCIKPNEGFERQLQMLN